MNKEFKHVLDAFYEVCNTTYTSYDLGELSLKEVFNIDVLKYILYLGAADEKITQEEATFIAEYLDWNMTISQWCEFINKQNIFIFG